MRVFDLLRPWFKDIIVVRPKSTRGCEVLTILGSTCLISLHGYHLNMVSFHMYTTLIYKNSPFLSIMLFLCALLSETLNLLTWFIWLPSVKLTWMVAHLHIFQNSVFQVLANLHQESSRILWVEELVAVPIIFYNLELNSDRVTNMLVGIAVRTYWTCWRNLLMYPYVNLKVLVI